MGNRMNKKKPKKEKKMKKNWERVTEKLEVKTSKTKRKRNIFVGIYNTNNRPWFFNSISSHLFIIVFSLLYGWCNRFIFMLVSKVRCNLNSAEELHVFAGNLMPQYILNDVIEPYSYHEYGQQKLFSAIFWSLRWRDLLWYGTLHTDITSIHFGNSNSLCASIFRIFNLKRLMFAFNYAIKNEHHTQKSILINLFYTP